MQRMKSIGSSLLEAFNSPLPNQSRVDQVRSALAGLALVFILLPWMPVGPTGSMTGSRLLGYSLFNDSLAAWFQANPLGAFLFVIAPALTILLSFTAFLAIMRGRNPVKTHLAIVVLPLLALRVASHPMMDSPPNALFGVPIPQIGLLHLVAIHLGLLLFGLYLKYWPSGWPKRSGP
ncbi:MAG: hypothetical protein OXR67_06360 [Chloroflexota bacterium]|nr:hypothetical protein [Chloroflexota bacterium]